MRLKRYDFNQHDETTFWFVSKGIKGEITKAVIFDAMDEPGRYNVGMGDWIEQTGDIEDEELSGNGDARKVFATVAEIVRHFTQAHTTKEVFLTGNTPDKKRTYCNMISFFLDELQVDFDIMGLNEEERLERFEKDKIYEAILVKRK